MTRSESAICSIGAAALSAGVRVERGGCNEGGSAFPPPDACKEEVEEGACNVPQVGESTSGVAAEPLLFFQSGYFGQGAELRLTPPFHASQATWHGGPFRGIRSQQRLSGGAAGYSANW